MNYMHIGKPADRMECEIPAEGEIDYYPEVKMICTDCDKEAHPESQGQFCATHEWQMWVGVLKDLWTERTGKMSAKQFLDEVEVEIEIAKWDGIVRSEP